MDQTRMLSVGIDIGTSTTQVVFSRLTLQNTAAFFSVPRIAIVDKEVIFRGDIAQTPLLDASRIDGDGVRALLQAAYAKAGVLPRQVETGAAIITGEAARKENAALVLESLSGLAGEFVVATAGPDLESIVAGQGSGAQRFSREREASVLNVDIGGGTSNLVRFDAGEAAGCGCLDIGGRQVRVEGGRIACVSPSAALIAADRGIPLAVGDAAEEGTLLRLCDAMSELLEQYAGAAPRTALLERLRTAGSSPLPPQDRPADYLCFSGGVAECVYSPGDDPFPYGDIGALLGRAIRRGRLFTAFRVLRAEETIRATVVGAGSYTTTVSGSTITYTPGLFPMKNVPVLRLTEQEEAACRAGDAGPLEERARWFLTQSDSDRLALALRGEADPEYEALRRLARTLAAAMDRVLSPGAPLVVVTWHDIAKALGQLLQRALGDRRPLVALDALAVGPGNYIDLGRPAMDGLVIPVVVKTLLFG